MSKNEYRIVKCGLGYYDVQIKRWWFPVWVKINHYSYIRFNSAEFYAKNYARKKSPREITNLGRLP